MSTPPPPSVVGQAAANKATWLKKLQANIAAQTKLLKEGKTNAALYAQGKKLLSEAPTGGVTPMRTRNSNGNLSTQVGWITGLIQGLGAQATPNTLGAVTAWTNAEGVWGKTGGSVVNNPLGVTLSYGVPSTGAFNSDGVLEFATPAQGLQATINFIKNRTPGIATALQDNATPGQLYGVVNSTGWAGSGGYPTPWVGGTPSRSRLPGGSTGTVTPMKTRPGGGPPGSGSSNSGTDVGSILDSYAQQQEQVPTLSGGIETQSSLFGIQLPSLNQIEGGLPFIGSLVSAVNSTADFLKILAWVINPFNILRMVEFLTGIVLMGFGIQAVMQGRGERAEGFETGEAAISRSGLGRVSRELAAKTPVGAVAQKARKLNPETAPHRTRRTALKVRYQREQNVAAKRTTQRRST